MQPKLPLLSSVPGVLDSLGNFNNPDGSIGIRAGVAGVRIEVHGVVQGVGFRPYVRNLAVACGLSGSVSNTRAGVTVELTGDAEAITEFLRRLPRQAPPLARLDEIVCREAATTPIAGFEIRASRNGAGEPTRAEISPDTAPCAACRADSFHPRNRRRGYAFTNCTHCGPRYTITRALPYDRERTTMAGFRLCPECEREYTDPSDRRYHAQPNACPRCGPHLWLGQARDAAALARAAAIIAAGGVVAIKNVGGYQFACDARQSAPVLRLRQAKQRSQKPFALLARDLEAARLACSMDEAERAALESAARPIVLMPRRAEADVAAAVAPAQPRLGVMLPSSPLHELLMHTPGMPGLVVMTSGNSGGEPLVYDDAVAERELPPLADGMLTHNRPIHMPLDDSVVFCFAGRPRLVRRARGYVPAPIQVPGEGTEIVFAAGGELKGAFCCLIGHRAYLGPYLGEMDRLETLERFTRTADHYLDLLGLAPARIAALAYDPHPAYHVTRWAQAWAGRRGIERFEPVQHHHAHVAACAAEHGIEGPAIGVAWDGTGYGDDGTVWGGEFFTGTAADYQRRARLRPVELVGGDEAVRQPWRLALGYLVAALGPDEAARAARRLWPRRRGDRLDWLLQRAATPGAGIACSAAGRLFDAVAALVGVAPERVSYEGEAAIALENACGDGGDRGAGYPLPYIAGDLGELDWRPMVAEILADLARGTRIEVVASRFHRGLAEAIAAVCAALAGAETKPVCLGGGTFQNRTLLRLGGAALEARGLKVYIPAQAPANDGGLALGQAMVARARLERERATSVGVKELLSCV